MRPWSSRLPKRARQAISLLEVLISVGVILFGVFGVVSLIYVARFQLQRGITADRQAAMGQRAVAEFRIRNLGSPGTRDNPRWTTATLNALSLNNIFDARGNVKHRAYCLDPLGVVNSSSNRFPVGIVGGGDGAYLQMLRITLTNRVDGTGFGPIGLPTINDMFLLPDDIVFQRPDEDTLPPRRQFFMYYDNPGVPPGVPTKTFANGSMSWMATITPVVAEALISNQPFVANDQYLLSVVVFEDRIPQPSTEEGFAPATSPYAGEIELTPPTSQIAGLQINVADLRIGDWLLLVKQQSGAGQTKTFVSHRWTQILGADERDGQLGVPRTFTIANDDFLQPLPLTAGNGIPVQHAIFMRGVVAVYEKIIRLENSTLWN